MKIKKVPFNELEFFTRGGSLFSHTSWLSAVQEGLGYASFGVVVERGSGECVCFPWLEARKFVWKMAGAPLPGCFTPYLDPIYEDGTSDEFVKAAEKEQLFFVLKLGYSYVEKRFRTKENIHFLSPSLFKVTYPETFCLRLDADLEKLWDRMEGRSRTAIRKARKMGVAVQKFVPSAADMAEFYEMLKPVFAKRKQAPPHPLSFYKAIAKYLGPLGRIIVMRAIHEGRSVGMGIFVRDKREVHFLSGASTVEGYTLGANNLIQWEVISWAKEEGLAFYDLGGKGVPSIDKFKRSLGGDVHAYSKVLWERGLLAPLRKAYYRFKHLDR